MACINYCVIRQAEHLCTDRLQQLAMAASGQVGTPDTPPKEYITIDAETLLGTVKYQVAGRVAGCKAYFEAAIAEAHGVFLANEGIYAASLKILKSPHFDKLENRLRKVESFDLMRQQRNVIKRFESIDTQHMVYMTMGIDQSHGAQACLCHKIFQNTHFRSAIAACINDDSLAAFVVEQVGVFGKRIKSERFYLHHTNLY